MKQKMGKTFLLLWIASCALNAALAPELPPKVTVAPEQVWIVPGDGFQKVNFDFMVANTGETPLSLVELRLRLRDLQGDFVLSRELNRQGMIASIRSLLVTEVEPGKTIQLLNPFTEFPGSVELGPLEYTLVFEPKVAEGTAGPKPLVVEVAVRPRAFRPQTRFALPLKGKVYVIDGSDFFAHHRRIDMTHPLIVQLGVKNNISRYGMDFVVLDVAGGHCKGDGARLEDYYVFGRPVLATAAATVADCVEGRPDNPPWEMNIDYDELLRTKDLRLLGGNFVVLDHGNGEFTYYAHLKQGSLKVKKGDRVTAGQQLGQVGNSGDSAWPHLHFQLMSCASFDCAHYPPVFANYTLFRGKRAIPVATGVPDTGDLVEGR